MSGGNTRPAGNSLGMIGCTEVSDVDRGRVFHLYDRKWTLECGCSSFRRLFLCFLPTTMSLLSKSYNLRGQALSSPWRRLAVDGRRTLATLQDKADVQGKA